MNIISGDLVKLATENQFSAIIHGANCFCTMGSGIAKQIKETFPEAYTADLYTKVGDIDKLGTYSSAIINRFDRMFFVINAYTQYDFRGRKNVDYDAIRNVFKLIKKDYGNLGKTFGYPAIGAGLAGGDWNIIHPIISEELFDENHTFVKYKR